MTAGPGAELAGQRLELGLGFQRRLGVQRRNSAVQHGATALSVAFVVEGLAGQRLEVS